MKFGENLRNLRQSAGLTLSDAGELMDIAGNTIGGWERGGREPSIKQIKKLTQCYRVDYNTLFGGSDNSPTAKLEVISQTIYSDKLLRRIYDATQYMSADKVKALADIAELLA